MTTSDAKRGTKTSIESPRSCTRVMVATFCLYFASLALAEIPSETSKDVGFGFREVQRTEATTQGAWEEIAHVAVLFYRDQELSRYDSYSISPSGRYALFQDGPTGEIVLFTRANAHRRKVSNFQGSLAKQYLWREDQFAATIVLENSASLRVSLRAH